MGNARKSVTMTTYTRRDCNKNMLAAKVDEDFYKGLIISAINMLQGPPGNVIAEESRKCGVVGKKCNEIAAIVSDWD